MFDWETIAEHRTLIMIALSIIVFLMVLHVINPSPFASMSKRIQVSLRMWHIDITVIDQQGNPIGNQLVWDRIYIGENVTLKNRTNVKRLIVTNTGQLPINLTITINGKQAGWMDMETGIKYEGWFLTEEGEFDFANAVLHITCNYAGETIDIGESYTLVFRIEAYRQFGEIIVELDIVPVYVE